MTTTLEKVRRAMDRAWLDAIEQCEREGKPSYPREIIRSHLARAAIQALREVPSRKFGPGSGALGEHPNPVSFGAARSSWEAMLQAILDEQKETA